MNKRDDSKIHGEEPKEIVNIALKPEPEGPQKTQVVAKKLWLRIGLCKGGLNIDLFILTSSPTKQPARFLQYQAVVPEPVPYL